eukprot:m.67251 g.67251  ORF g.67251 m.67251 type:complete len:79 (+) comp8211_c0_seq3:663-899(+)
MILKINRRLKSFADEFEEQRKSNNPLIMKLALVSPGCTRPVMITTFRVNKGYESKSSSCMDVIVIRSHLQKPIGPNNI